MKIPPKRQGLGNAYGSHVQTTDPVPACKPDMREYRVRTRRDVPEDCNQRGTAGHGCDDTCRRATPEDRRRAWVKLQSSKPAERKWRVEHGVVDLSEGGVKTFTGKCQRDGCRSGGSRGTGPSTTLGDGQDRPLGKCSHGRKCRGWFSVQRPASQDAPWPRYCSEDCASIAKGVADRKSAKRVRAGIAEKREPIRYLFDSFDPDAPDAWQRAYDIVIATPRSLAHDERWAPDDVWIAAHDYLERCTA